MGKCIGQDILADFLKKQRGEVKDVILTEYNAERHIKNEKKLSYEEGVKEGMEQGIKAFIAEKEEENADKNIIIEKMQRHFLLDKDRAEHYYKRFTNKI